MKRCATEGCQKWAHPRGVICLVCERAVRQAKRRALAAQRKSMPKQRGIQEWKAARAEALVEAMLGARS